MKTKKEIIYTWVQYNSDIKELAGKLKRHTPFIKSIYGIPRGGFFVAASLSYLLDKKLLSSPKECTKNTLIVDDICDTGRTFFKFGKGYKHYDFVSLWVGSDSKFSPRFWVREKRSNEWVVFPWEINDKN